MPPKNTNNEPTGVQLNVGKEDKYNFSTGMHSAPQRSRYSRYEKLLSHLHAFCMHPCIPVPAK